MPNNYQILAANMSTDWTITGWSYEANPQYWKRLSNGRVLPHEVGLVVTRDNFNTFDIYFVAENPTYAAAHPENPDWYSDAATVTPDPNRPGSTIPVNAGQ